MKKNKQVGMNLTEGNVARQMILFAIPIMLATALQTVYSMVDMAVVGRLVGGTGLSSVTVASQIVQFMTCICMGLSGGAMVVISQYVGARRTDRLGSIIGNTITLHLLFAVFFSLIGVIFCKPILRLVNAPEEAMSGAVGYLIISSIGLVFVYGYNMISSVLRGMGDSTRPLYFIAISSCLNIVLDLLLVGPLKLGAPGAALATIISQAVAFIIALVYIYRKQDAMGITFSLASLRPDREISTKLLQQGMPQVLMLSAVSLSVVIVSAWVNANGVNASAAYGVGSRLDQLPMILTTGFATAVATMVGQNFAAKKYDRIRKITSIALVISLFAYGVFAILYVCIPEQLFGLFTNDSGVIALARTVLSALLIGFPASVLLNSYRGVVTGVGNARLTLILGLLDGIVFRLGFAYLLGIALDLGLFGLIAGYALAPYGTAIPSAIYYFSGIWKKRESLVSSPAGPEAAG